MVTIPRTETIHKMVTNLLIKHELRNSCSGTVLVSLVIIWRLSRLQLCEAGMVDGCLAVFMLSTHTDEVKTMQCLGERSGEKKTKVWTDMSTLPSQYPRAAQEVTLSLIPFVRSFVLSLVHNQGVFSKPKEFQWYFKKV